IQPRTKKGRPRSAMMPPMMIPTTSVSSHVAPVAVDIDIDRIRERDGVRGALPVLREHGQSHHGTHFQALSAAIGQPQDVVEKTVLLIPHSNILASMYQRRGNPQEVLDELDAHLGI